MRNPELVKLIDRISKGYAKYKPLRGIVIMSNDDKIQSLGYNSYSLTDIQKVDIMVKLINDLGINRRMILKHALLNESILDMFDNLWI